MIKSTPKIEGVKITSTITSETLLYPCLLRYACHGYDYVVLAIEPSLKSFKGIIVKVFNKDADDEIFEGAIDNCFSLTDFGTPEGFNFYNKEITIKNSANYQ